MRNLMLMKQEHKVNVKGLKWKYLVSTAKQ